MHNPGLPKPAVIAMVCAGIAALCTGLQSTARAAEIYGIEAVRNGYVMRSFDTDRPEAVRELVAVPATPGEQLRGLVQLDDRRIALVRTVAADTASARNELLVMGLPGQLTALLRQDVAGLESYATLSQVLVAWGARYYGLVGRDDDRPPYQIVTLFSGSTGIFKLTSVDLPAHARYANLTQCPDGSIYGTSLAPQQNTRLVKLDPESANVVELPELKFGDRTLPDDLFGLTCDLNGRLYALADPTRRGTASLFGVDATTGTLTWLGFFAAHKITFVKPR